MDLMSGLGEVGDHDVDGQVERLRPKAWPITLMEGRKMTWQAVATLAIATLGAVLGIINTWMSFRRDRVRLSVKLSHALAVPTGVSGYALGVTNVGGQTVVVEEFGFVLKGQGAKTGQRLAVLAPVFADGGSWPRRLAAREVVTGYFVAADLPRFRGGLGRAYVRTACGRYFYGWTAAIGDLQTELASS